MKTLLAFILLIISLRFSYGQRHFSSVDTIKSFSLRYDALGNYPFWKSSIDIDSLGQVIAEFGWRKNSDSKDIFKLISRKKIQLDKLTLSQVKRKIISIYKFYELPNEINDTTGIFDGYRFQLTITSQIGTKSVHGVNPDGINNLLDNIIELINNVVGFMALEDEYDIK